MQEKEDSYILLVEMQISAAIVENSIHAPQKHNKYYHMVPPNTSTGYVSIGIEISLLKRYL